MSRSELLAICMDCAFESLSAVSVNALVFLGGEIWNEDEPDTRINTILQSVPGPSSATANGTSQSDEEQRVSAYVRVFEDMVCTVIKEENHLLNAGEIAILTVFSHLSYNARYLMVKLLLRKQEAWHRLDSLKYEGELGSTSAIVNAIDELCLIGPISSDVVKDEPKERAIVDLTIDESVANIQQELAKPASADVGASGALSENKPVALARCEREMDLKSLLECLRTDELKAVAKQLKLKQNQAKNDLINDLLGSSGSQTTLTSFYRVDVTPSKGDSSDQTFPSLGKLKSQRDRLRDIALSRIVKCVRVDEEFFGVIHRVNLVYFRLNQYIPGLNVTALLARFGIRTFPGYKHERTRNIWPSRQALLDYEEVLVLDAEIDALLAGNVPLLGGRTTRSKTPPKLLSTSVTSGNTTSTRRRKDPGGDEDVKPDIKLDSARPRGARMVKDIFERVYPRWQDLVKLKGEAEGRTNGLERFHHGHVLTRIICKGCTALGVLGDHVRELEVLEALLAQKRWKRGQRGRWYERRAVILSNYFPEDNVTLKRTWDAVIDGLEDSDTHLVFRPKLQRRLRTLENKLKIPIEDRHKCDGVLAKADKVVFKAVRLRPRAASLKLDRTGRSMDANITQQDIQRYASPLPTLVKPEQGLIVGSTSHHKSPSDVRKGKSIWLGRNGEELTVEGLALQRYVEQGFKGVHCETRVITMLFMLLFWDIVFEPIPGAFETPYQTAPLDIAEDSFYHARREHMEERLSQIEAGKGVNFLQAADAENRASGTWCVGVQWDLFSSEDLVDIVTCIGGKALSVICRVLCEDYKSGASGGPDLFLWNTENGACKFVEVKGPGDNLQENQRIWIDILLKAPVVVEICRVEEEGDETDKPNAKTPKSTRKKSKKTPRKVKDILVDEDADALPTVFGNTNMSAENQAISIGSCLSPGPVGPRTSSAMAAPPSNPPKRKGKPLDIASPSPSKRPRIS
ncbi:hypothetical protein JVU11DRAFT_860 [Chiua virens]|nr:hypothetical protein JVU11DRAFT_860 [Chiua virens]